MALYIDENSILTFLEFPLIMLRAEENQRIINTSVEKLISEFSSNSSNKIKQKKILNVQLFILLTNDVKFIYLSDISCHKFNGYCNI